jgi:1-deoxy-D-xylulose-5-phosphate reductoisomerase
LVGIRQLRLNPPDVDRFPALRLGHEVADRGGTAGAVLNAANETAVSLFRDGSIHFLDIARIVERVLRDHPFVKTPALSDLQAADAWAREEVNRCMTC